MMMTDMERISVTQADGDRSVAMRHAMVASQLRTTSVDDQRVVAAMTRTPRENFLPAAAREVAYRDTAVPLGAARWANLPLATGRLLTAAHLRSQDRVLLIGAAGGYTAALLADIVAHVVAVESDSALIAIAEDQLAGVEHVSVVEGALADGHAAGAPYDVLIIDGAVSEVPATLIDQLRPDGRAVMGIVDRGLTRLASGARTAHGFSVMPFLDCDCVVLPGFDRPQPFRF